MNQKIKNKNSSRKKINFKLKFNNLSKNVCLNKIKKNQW